jgi:predicted nucleic acid-binding protein
MKYLLDTTVLVNHLRGKKPIKIDFFGKRMWCIDYHSS